MNVYLAADNTVLAMNETGVFEPPTGTTYTTAIVPDASTQVAGLAIICPQKCSKHQMDPTTFAITHYPPVVVNANQGFINHLNTLTIASGSDADTLRKGVIDYLSGQPAVPAV